MEIIYTTKSGVELRPGLRVVEQQLGRREVVAVLVREARQLVRVELRADGVDPYDLLGTKLAAEAANQPELARAEIRAAVHAWQQTLKISSALGWWFTLKDAESSGWYQIADVEAGEQVLNTSLQWFPEPWGDVDEPNALPPLDHLALMALHQEESW